MAERPSPRPTDAELSILRVLWERGPSTVRDVHELLSTTQGTGYTTILKLMQIMTEKGLVVRDETERAHVYEARQSEQRTQRQRLQLGAGPDERLVEAVLMVLKVMFEAITGTRVVAENIARQVGTIAISN